MRKKTVIPLINLLGILVTSCGEKEKATPEKTSTVKDVKVETVRLSPIEGYYEAIGTVRSKTTSVLSSKIIGYVKTIHVHEGDRVRAGQLLIEIDDRDARAQLQKAQAGLREAQDALEEVERTIRASEASKEAAEAHKALAASTFDRYKSLRESQIISQQQFDEAQAKYRMADAEVDRANKVLQSVMAKKNQVLAKIDQAKADVANAQIYLGYTRITSPISGIVTARQIDVGFLAVPGVPLLTIEDDTQYRLEASVEESQIGKIHLKDPVRVRIDALGDKELEGRVTEIVPASDPASRSYTVKIDLPTETKETDTPQILRSGLFGRAHFSLGHKEVIMVLQKAIIERGQLTNVYVVDSSHIARLRLIKTGKQYGDRVEVLSGLNDGDQVVVEGIEALDDGSQVRSTNAPLASN
ncbi:MAG TPA: efflux RND transporter periplasmic adaptor subunit [Candidatus Limnocylindrales bacterium]|nr:efflux RND transporter periplasmic adaptor subunit [Candidatus Limnocylindrales bacterium]